MGSSMAPGRVRFGADGPPWASLSPPGVWPFFLPYDHTILAPESPSTTVSAVEALSGDLGFLRSNGDPHPWLAVDCAWTGRGTPAQVLSLSTMYYTAVIPLYTLSSHVPARLQALLSAEHVPKACTNLLAVSRTLAHWRLPLAAAWETGIVSREGGMDVPPLPVSLSDQCLASLHRTVLVSRELRAADWGGELSAGQREQVARHSFATWSLVDAVRILFAGE